MYNAFFGWKTLLYKDKCEAILKGEFQAPVTLHVYPNNSCNNNCTFCIMKDERRGEEQLDYMVFSELMTDANDMGIPSIHISGGGEPTLYPFLSAVEKYNGFKVLSTNGRELTRDKADMFDRIRISINAGSREVYQKVNGSNEWDKLMSRISDLTEDRTYELGLGFVADHNNWHDIARCCKIAEDLKLDFVHIRPAYYSNETDGAMVKKIAKSIYLASQSASEVYNVPIFSISDKFNGFWSERTYEKCLATPLHGVVTADAKMTVCQDVFHKFGDLNTQSIKEIWGSDEHKEAISRINVDSCPRCVMNKSNEIMEKVFINNDIMMELL